MKPTKFLLFFIVALFVVTWGLSSSAKDGSKSNVPQDTTSLIYWKDMARKNEAYAHMKMMESNRNKMMADQKTKEAMLNKKLYDDSQVKVKELTSLLEECKKGKP